MAVKGFIFDYTKCIGCHACIVACHNENGVEPPMAWRQVQTANKIKIPLSGFINLSIACNHCENPVCLAACPAKAYTIDTTTGAVIHHSDRCMGCRYCTWACPFDAPKFNPLKGVVEKCSLCNNRLLEGLNPACVEACPVGALSFGEIDVKESVLAPGFSEKKLRPKVLPLNSTILEKYPIQDISATGFEQHNDKEIISVKSKISAKNEIPLVFFTFILAISVGWFGTTLFEKATLTFKYIFVLLGFMAFVASTFHLGKPFRAYRSILNIKKSWLSREILLFGIFEVSSILYLFVLNEIWLQTFALLSGLFLLFAVDMIYSVTLKISNIPHSSSTLLTAILVFSMLLNYIDLFLIIASAKLMLYFIRYFKSNKQIGFKFIVLPFMRTLLLLLPLASAIVLREIKLSGIIMILTAELIDRIEFYNDLVVETPETILNQNKV